MKWNECTDQIQYDFSHDSMLPLYAHFLNNTDLRVFVYSGNMDSVLPTSGTLGWINRLARPIVKPWQPWLGDDRQLGGYITEYDRMSFIVVHGAGHMVPGERPFHARDLISSLITGQPLVQ